LPADLKVGTTTDVLVIVPGYDRLAGRPKGRHYDRRTRDRAGYDRLAGRPKGRHYDRGTRDRAGLVILPADLKVGTTTDVLVIVPGRRKSRTTTCVRSAGLQAGIVAS
jgi:hypothetical protein